MGYADTSQVGSGLRQRLYTRAFIVGNPSNEAERVVYLVLDTQSGDTAIRDGIIKGVAALGSEYSVYTKNNIAVTGTHSHSGPGAWLNYLLPQITSFGFSPESYSAIVEGSVRAIQRAHESLTTGSVSVGTADLPDGNANRSPYAYLANPESERSKYQSDTDKTMTLIKFTRASDGKAIGLLNWYPVHGTSLYQNNTLSTGDNKGVAAYLFEKFAATDSSAAPGFVAGFSQANVGDTTPNVLGAFCEDTGLACRFNDSTCGGVTQGCHGRGPFWQVPDNGTQSCYEIGRRQFETARSIYTSSNMTPISGSTVTGFHTYQDMENFTFVSPFNSSKEVTTCSAALGFGFAGGTTDGPGLFDFTQGANTSDPDSPAQSNPLWVIARDVIHIPSKEQKVCQAPKEILLDVGASTVPYQWSPNIIDVQLLRVGSLIMIIAPGEATTMSGRRWRDAIASAANSVLSIKSPTVVLGGPANTYAHYIATEEEYGVQRYEGASTLYGPHTLEGHINLTVSNLPYLVSSTSAARIPDGPSPPINTNRSLSFITGVVYDNPPILKSFGDIVSNPSSTTTYSASGPHPTTVFVAANPRNNLRLDQTFAAVEKRGSNGTWTTYRTDEDWNLVYRWVRTNGLLGNSEVSITWEIENSGVEAGTYRMRYWGDSKAPLTGKISSFTGTSGSFQVAAS